MTVDQNGKVHQNNSAMYSDIRYLKTVGIHRHKPTFHLPMPVDGSLESILQFPLQVEASLVAAISIDS